MSDEDQPPFDDIFKQMQEFIQKMLAKAFGGNVNFNEILERFKEMAQHIDPEQLEELFKQSGGAALGFSLTFGPNGEPIFNPIQGPFASPINVTSPQGAPSATKKKQVKEPYYEWIEINHGEWELIIQLPGVSEDKIALDVTNTTVSLRAESDDVIYDTTINIEGKFAPNKKIHSEFRNGLLVVTTTDEIK